MPSGRLPSAAWASAQSTRFLGVAAAARQHQKHAHRADKPCR
ncbi:hypothetical protein [Deinococcus sp.]